MDVTFIVLLLFLAAIVSMGLVLIFQRKKYKAEQKKEVSLSIIFDAMPFSIIVCDKDLNIVEAHHIPSYIERSLSRNGFKGMNVNNLRNEANHEFGKAVDKIVDHFLKASRLKENVEFVVNFVSNEEFKMLIFNLVYNHQDGSIIAYIQIPTFNNEVVSKKRQSNLINEVVENTPIAVCIKNPYEIDRLLYYNQKFKDKTFVNGSWNPQEYMNFAKTSSKLMKREDELVMMNDKPMSFDRTFYDESGNPFKYCEVIKSKLKLSHFDDDVLMLCLILDVTEKKEFEKEIDKEKIKMRAILNMLSIEQWDYDILSNQLTYYNVENFKNKKTLSKDERLLSIHPDDMDLALGFFRKMDVGDTEIISIEYRSKQDDSTEYKWIESNAAALERDANGRIIKYTGNRRDIQYQKMINQELIQLRDKAIKSNDMKSASLADMSHEIRTPLNAIIGFSNLMLQAENMDEKNEYLKIIKNNNDILLQLINDILDLSKIESGKLEFHFSDVDINEIISNQVQIMSLRAKEGVKIVSKIPLKYCRIKTDKNRLTQVIANFMSNACKYTEQGKIEVGYEQIENGLKFYVSDTGIGISKENLPTVFNRFSKFSTLSGNGLGLAISQTIINCLKGEVGVESELDKGSTFWATIPCEVNTTTKTEKEKMIEKKEEKQSVNEKKLNLIVAEDNDSNYFLIYILLKDYNVKRAVNGKEAVELFEKEKPDVILMDIKMPVMDGYEATKIIREKDKHIPIIALTANVFEVDKEKVLAAGCDAFIAKPIDVKMLQQTIQKLTSEE